MIRSLAIAAVLEAVIIAFLMIGATPPVRAMRGLPAIDVVSIDTMSVTQSPLPSDSSSQPPEPALTPSTPKPESTPSVRPKAPNESKGGSAKSGNLDGPSATTSSGPPGKPVAGDRLDRGVVLLSGDYPTYPKDATNDDIKKDVKVKILINTDGSVESVTPIDGDDQWGFSRAIRIAVMKWRFQPGSVSGYPTQFFIMKTFRFDPTR